MRRVRLAADSLHAGPHFSLSLQRTLRIPDDGNTYPLPPGLGRFPVRRVRDYWRTVPREWRETGGWFIPMYQREALWLCFSGHHWHPVAVKIGVGGINALSGARFDTRLRARPQQDYLVAPDQPWLDGIKAGEGIIRQFVAMPLGSGVTVEGQLTGEETTGGIQVAIIEPKPGRFPERPPRPRGLRMAERSMVMACASPAMGLGAGGRMVQKVYPDGHGRATWDASRVTHFTIHIANSAMWRRITGEPIPRTPIDAATYTRYGLPWFALYDEHRRDIAVPDELRRVKSLGELEPRVPDAPVAVSAGQTVGLTLPA